MRNIGSLIQTKTASGHPVSLKDQIRQADEILRTLQAGAKAAMYSGNSTISAMNNAFGLSRNPLAKIKNEVRYVDGLTGEKAQQEVLKRLKDIKPRVNLDEACFAAGTLVHTKNGLKPIEQIKVGDLVLSKHESGKGERAYKRVTKTFVHEDRQVIMVTVGGMQADGKWRGHRFAVTPEHPFWVQGKGWNEVGTLIASVMKPTKLEIIANENPALNGHLPLFVTSSRDFAWAPLYPKDFALGGAHFDLRTMELGEKTELFQFKTIKTIKSAKRAKPEHLFKTTVYNIEVEDFHTYYVGEVGVWVHNKNFQVMNGGPAITAAMNSKVFWSRGELNAYLSLNPGEINKVFIVRSGTGQKVSEVGRPDPIALQDLLRWQRHEENAVGRLRVRHSDGSLGDRFEYALAYRNPDGSIGFLAIEGRSGLNVFEDMKLDLVKAGKEQEIMSLLNRSSLRLAANVEEKIIYRFNPAQPEGLTKANEFLTMVKNGEVTLGNRSADDPISLRIRQMLEDGRISARNADIAVPPQNVLSEGPGIDLESVSQADIDALLPLAKQYWLNAGASAGLLNSATFSVADLPEGFAAWAEGSAITLDASGAGWGWYLDESPIDSSEFAVADTATAFHVDDEDTDNPAIGRLDLLTVLIHELGHIVNLPSTATSYDVMSQYLAPGQRRLLSGADIAALQAAGSPYFQGVSGVQTLTVPSQGSGTPQGTYSALVLSSAWGSVHQTLANGAFAQGVENWRTAGRVVANTETTGSGVAVSSVTLGESIAPTGQTRLTQSSCWAPTTASSPLRLTQCNLNQTALARKTRSRPRCSISTLACHSSAR